MTATDAKERFGTDGRPAPPTTTSACRSAVLEKYWRGRSCSRAWVCGRVCSRTATAAKASPLNSLSRCCPARKHPAAAFGRPLPTRADCCRHDRLPERLAGAVRELLEKGEVRLPDGRIALFNAPDSLTCKIAPRRASFLKIPVNLWEFSPHDHSKQFLSINQQRADRLFPAVERNLWTWKTSDKA